MVEASDEEACKEGERLALLAVVRGLEALDQPSRVTLVTSSSSIGRSLRYSLDQWRANAWRWERDGRLVPIKNADLWKRVDRAMQFHQVECKTWRFDDPHAQHRTEVDSATDLATGESHRSSRVPVEIPAWSDVVTNPVRNACDWLRGRLAFSESTV